MNYIFGAVCLSLFTFITYKQLGQWKIKVDVLHVGGSISTHKFVSHSSYLVCIAAIFCETMRILRSLNIFKQLIISSFFI